jgi:hypothetical protein
MGGNVPAIFMQLVRLQTLSLSADVRTLTGFFPLKVADFWLTLYHGNTSFVNV